MSYNHHHRKMKAVRWEGKPFSVSVKTLPVPKIANPHDAIIRITSAGICGSDLHIWRSRFPSKPPFTIGHEIVGIVHTIGDNVENLKIGDRVIVSGSLEEPALDGAEIDFGAVGLGTVLGEQVNGGQAGFVRVPFAADNCILLPEGTKHELDYVALADIFPTANWALDCAGFTLGDVVVVFGAGPLGLLTIYSAFLRGASKVYSVDHVPQRLAKAKNLGAVPIDFSAGDPVAHILKLEPQGVDRSCDCVGYECVNAEGVNVGNLVISQAIAVTRFGGGIGLIGAFITEDAGAATSAARKGIFEVPLGESWMKSQTIKGGVVQLRQYQPVLKKLIDSGRAKPGFVIDKEIHIEDAPKAYQGFADHKFIKAIIRFDDDDDADAKLVEEDEIVEQAPIQRKRKRNGT